MGGGGGGGRTNAILPESTCDNAASTLFDFCKGWIQPYNWCVNI